MLCLWTEYNYVNVITIFFDRFNSRMPQFCRLLENILRSILFQPIKIPSLEKHLLWAILIFQKCSTVFSVLVISSGAWQWLPWILLYKQPVCVRARVHGCMHACVCAWVSVLGCNYVVALTHNINTYISFITYTYVNLYLIKSIRHIHTYVDIYMSGLFISLWVPANPLIVRDK